jgi:hypothetical protein
MPKEIIARLDRLIDSRHINELGFWCFWFGTRGGDEYCKYEEFKPIHENVFFKDISVFSEVQETPAG